MIQFIEDADLDAQFGRTLIAARAGAADIGEALATLGRVSPGDYDSWATAWEQTAQRAQDAAAASAAGGHAVSAGQAYLRASEYWRQAFFFHRHDVAAPRLQAAWRRHRETFRAALPHLGVDATIAEIPFEGASMTAYLLRAPRAGGDDVTRPTLIVPCGYDSTAEAGYVATGFMALARGYDFFVFEGPGQGGMLYEHGVPMRPDFEVPFAAAFTWLLEQPSVDAEAIAIVGRSFGGYLAPRAAAFEPRLAALVCDPGQFDFATRMRPLLGDKFDALLAADAQLDDELEGLLDGPRNHEWYGARMATLGQARVGAFMRAQLQYDLTGVAERITCPTLITEGEGDFAAQGAALLEHLQGPKQLKTFTADEGAGGHCEGLGSTLWEQHTFDWLDKVLRTR